MLSIIACVSPSIYISFAKIGFVILYVPFGIYTGSPKSTALCIAFVSSAIPFPIAPNICGVLHNSFALIFSLNIVISLSYMSAPILSFTIIPLFKLIVTTLVEIVTAVPSLSNTPEMPNCTLLLFFSTAEGILIAADKLLISTTSL